MPVYVDDMHKTSMGRYGRMKMCHMVADTVDELHAMADKIGVARQWYQGPPKTINPHYDICTKMRDRAIACGATELTMRQAVHVINGMQRKAIEDYMASQIKTPPDL